MFPVYMKAHRLERVTRGGAVQSGTRRFLVVMTAVTGFAIGIGASEGPRILTQPVGLVRGPLDVATDLGDSAGSGVLFLDGTEVCTGTSTESNCRVDLGSDLHVHLLGGRPLAWPPG